MGNRRQLAISRSVQRALSRDPATLQKTLLERIRAFFRIFYVTLVRYEQEIFSRLRNEVWDIGEEEYQACFRREELSLPLVPMGDLGFSGSDNHSTSLRLAMQTFLRTSNSEFLVKSIPRHFEHAFFREDLLALYYEYMMSHLDSLLVWITDYVYAPYTTIGGILRITPAHHIIMENLLCGKDHDAAKDKWETYDLKPTDYFYPERDLVPEPLINQDTLSRLADKFEDKIRLTRKDYEMLKRTIEADTRFLASANVVDYSLFLIRFPASSEPGIIGRKDPWRVGMPSADGKWKYRAALLDFFWAKHTLHARAMTGAVQAFNIFGRQGPMTITTTADEYREKFLAMVDEMMKVHEL